MSVATEPAAAPRPTRGPRRMMKGVAWTFAARVIALPLSLAYSILLARLFPVEAVGVYQLGVSLSSVLAAVLTLGLGLAAQQLITRDAASLSLQRGWVNASIASTFVVASLAGFTLWLARARLHEAFGIGEIVLLLALSLPFLALIEVEKEIYRAYGEAAWVATINGVFLPLAKLILVLAFAYGWSRSSDAAFGSHAIASMAAALAILLLLPGRAGFDRSVRPDYGRSRELVVLGAPLIVYVAAWLLLGAYDVLLLGWMSTTAETGVYAIAKRIAALLAVPLLAVNAAVPAAAARHYRAGEMDAYETVVRDAGRWCFLASGILVVVIIAHGREVLAWFGPRYVDGYPVLVAVTLGQFVQSASGPTGQLLNMVGRHRHLVIATIVSLGVGMALAVPAIRAYGALGAAISTAFSLTLWNVLTGWSMRVATRRSWLPNHASGLIAFALLGGLAGMATRALPPVVGVIACGLLVTLIALAVGLTPRERARARGLLGRRTRS